MGIVCQIDKSVLESPEWVGIALSTRCCNETLPLPISLVPVAGLVFVHAPTCQSYQDLCLIDLISILI